MKSFKTGRQRRTNQQKLKRTKASLATRKAIREMEEKNTIRIPQQKSVTKGVTRYRTQSRFSAFKSWLGEKITGIKRLFETKKQKQRRELFEHHVLGKGPYRENFVPPTVPFPETNTKAPAGGGGDGRYYREAIDPPEVKKPRRVGTIEGTGGMPIYE